MTAALSAVLVGLVIVAFGLTTVTPRRLYVVTWLVCALLIGTLLVVRCTGGTSIDVDTSAVPVGR